MRCAAHSPQAVYSHQEAMMRCPLPKTKQRIFISKAAISDMRAVRAAPSRHDGIVVSVARAALFARIGDNQSARYCLRRNTRLFTIS
ncbi:hypothetical protein C9I57_04185 [Trinickia symbiotica]|uniref:Uncharacterized protein n=1 Tax=Trinickia symbiotica TaxID=863227 RepID=A0A2T3XZD7_9BURK|nr:hypothetical protein C9I57_04185 [Trinickia symbiotica]